MLDGYVSGRKKKGEKDIDQRLADVLEEMSKEVNEKLRKADNISGYE